MSIKAIIWDVGGVLERTEDLQPRQELAARLQMPVSKLSDLIFGNDDHFRLQFGKISREEHLRNVAQILNLPPSEMESVFTEFFAGDVLDLELIDKIRGFKQNYCSTIISNYSTQLRTKINEIWMIEDAFNHVIISAEVGMMKPKPEIYHLALRQIGVDAEESVFIDDFIENINAAQSVGMQGILFQNKEQALSELTTLITE